jgi:beta-N-acetylhexosaminidase
VAFVPFWEKTKSGGSFKTEFYKFSKTAETDLEIAPNLYANPAIRDSLWNWVIQSRLTNTYDKSGGFRMVYSDLGLVMLQKIVERITNQPLDEFVEQNVYEPLGMTATLYNPTRKFSKTNIAPTENDIPFRGIQIQGTVHDPTAAVLGGVSGNAGIFSNALDLVKLFQMNLQNGIYGGRRILFEGTVKHFATNWTQKSHRGLGWDKPDIDKESSTISSMTSSNTYGHTGFTGTCAWIDPDKELVFIMLSNRVYPTIRNTITTLKIRKRLHDVVYGALL